MKFIDFKFKTLFIRLNLDKMAAAFCEGGSKDPRYILKLLFSENQKIVWNSMMTEAREKISAIMESLEF